MHSERDARTDQWLKLSFLRDDPMVGQSSFCIFRVPVSIKPRTSSIEARPLQQACITSSKRRPTVSGNSAAENRISTSSLSKSPNGSFPVSIMYIVEPSPNMSSWASHGVFGNVGRQKRVELQTRALEPCNEEPAKSQTLRSRFSSSRKLSGLTSQCITPRVCRNCAGLSLAKASCLAF